MKRSSIKQHIIETAASLFYHKGYNLTGINEIIKEAGIAKATLYSHFASKEDICLAYLTYKNSTFREDLKTFVHTKNGKDQLYALFYFLIDFFNQEDFNGCWCLNTISEIPKENERIRREIIQQKESFIDFIKTLVEKNHNQDSDQKNKKMARKIYLLYESAISESKLHNNTWPIKANLDICKHIIE